MDIENLYKYAKEQDLRSLAKSSCLAYLDCNKNNLPNNWAAHKFECEFKSISLIFEHAFQLEPYFETKYILFYEGSDVGCYKMLTSLSSEADDEFILLNDQHKI